MKFKVGDKVRIIKADRTWGYWCNEMGRLVGQTHTIVGEWDSWSGTYPTLIIKGYDRGLHGSNREEGEYGFPEHCLELAVKPGEQLEFDFMKEDIDV